MCGRIEMDLGEFNGTPTHNTSNNNNLNNNLTFRAIKYCSFYADTLRYYYSEQQKKKKLFTLWNYELRSC